MKEFTVTVKKVDKVPKETVNEKGEKVTQLEEVIKEVPVDIVPIKIKKGKGKGGEYLAPKNVSSFDLNWILGLFSPEELINKLLRPKLKQFCATITAEAASEAGKVTASDVKEAAKKGKKLEIQPIQDEEKFIDSFSRMFQTLSPRGESVAGLTRQQNELLAEFGDLDESAPDFEERSMAIFRQIKKVREALESKTTTGEGDEEGDESDSKQAVAA